MNRWAWSVALAFLAGCSGPRTTGEQLRSIVGDFHHHLVVGDFVRASAMVEPEAFDSFSALHDPAVNVIRIEDFDILTVKLDTERNEAVVLIAADARRENSLTIKPLRLRQVWREIGGTWRLHAEEVVRPGAMPAIGGDSKSPQ
jgi:hypothetical protein